MAVRGGQKLKRMINEGQNAKGVRGVRVGLFASSVYPKVGTGRHGKRQGYRRRRKRVPVTSVAAWIEFGTRSRKSGKTMMRARPVMKTGNVMIEHKAPAFFKARVDSVTMVVDRQTAEHFGLMCVREYQQAIHSFRPPPIDTGFYKRSFTHQVMD